MKEEALKLADELDALHQYVPSEAPAMIRRLVEELDKQCEPVARIVEDLDIEWTKVHKLPVGTLLYTAQQTKPTITKVDGKVVAITMTDNEHRVHEFLWEAPKPLSDDEINEIAMYCSDMNEYGHSKLDEFAFARAIEERHGIK